MLSNQLLQALGVGEVRAGVVTLGAQRVGDRAGDLGVTNDGLDNVVEGHVAIITDIGEVHYALLLSTFAVTNCSYHTPGKNDFTDSFVSGILDVDYVMLLRIDNFV